MRSLSLPAAVSVLVLASPLPAADRRPLRPDDFFATKRVAPPQSKELLAKFRTVLAATDPFEIGPLEEALKKFIDEQQIKIGDIIHTLRVAVTGKSVGPGVYDCLAILGRESSLARIDRALAR